MARNCVVGLAHGAIKASIVCVYIVILEGSFLLILLIKEVKKKTALHPLLDIYLLTLLLNSPHVIISTDMHMPKAVIFLGLTYGLWK